MPSNEPQHETSGSSRLLLPAIVLGIALFALSFLPVLASGRERWTKEQAVELQQASMRIQELTHELGTQTPETASKKTATDFQDALHHFQNLQAELKDARSRSGSLGAVLRVMGLLLVAGGVTSYALSKRQKAAESKPFQASRTP